METVSLDCKYMCSELLSCLLYHHLKKPNIKSDNFKPSGGHCGRDCMISG